MFAAEILKKGIKMGILDSFLMAGAYSIKGARAQAKINAINREVELRNIQTVGGTDPDLRKPINVYFPNGQRYMTLTYAKEGEKYFGLTKEQIITAAKHMKPYRGLNFCFQALDIGLQNELDEDWNKTNKDEKYLYDSSYIELLKSHQNLSDSDFEKWFSATFNVSFPDSPIGKYKEAAAINLVEKYNDVDDAINKMNLWYSDRDKIHLACVLHTYYKGYGWRYLKKE